MKTSEKWARQDSNARARTGATVMVFDARGCGKSVCLPITQLLTNNEPIVSSSPAVVNGSVYFGSADQLSSPIGRLYVFKLFQ